MRYPLLLHYPEMTEADLGEEGWAEGWCAEALAQAGHVDVAGRAYEKAMELTGDDAVRGFLQAP